MKTILVDDILLDMRLFELKCADMPEFEIVGKFTDPAEAVEFATHNVVEFALLDIDMPGMNGMELAVKLAAYLGLRRSEICGLRWGCVDLREGVLTVREVRTQVGGVPVTKAPKTASSVRKLGIGGLPDLQDALLRAWARRSNPGDPAERVLRDENGFAPEADWLSYRLAEIVRQNNLPKITLHGLRHSFASVANQQGVNMFHISKALGHSSMAITSSIYTHLFDDTEAAVLETVARAIEGPGR